MNPSKIKAFLALTRAYMALVIGCTAVAGGILAGMSGGAHLLYLFFAEYSIAAGGFALNDVLDRDRDREVNCKPLAAGSLSLRNAVSFAGLLAVIGILLSVYLGTGPAVLGAIQLLTVWAYSWMKRHSGILANGITAVLCASSFLFGSSAQHHLGLAWVPALLTLELIWAREIVKDILDLEADRQVDLPTVPLLYGVKRATFAVTAIVFLTVITSLTLPIKYSFGFGYFALMGLVDVTLLAITFRLLRRNSSDEAGVFLNISAALLPFAILACLA